MANENVLKDFTYRKQIALKGDKEEITGRLLGLVEWMQAIGPIATILQEIRNHGGAKLMDRALINKAERPALSLDPILPPDARSIEQIASVGLALIEEAREQNRNIFDVATDFGIFMDLKGSDRYLIPFLDYVQHRLPTPPVKRHLGEGIAPPAVVHDSLKLFSAANRNAGKTAFIMMRFGKTPAHNKIEATIKKALKRYGFVGLLARDTEFHDELFPNILTYMHGCAFGIAVFERLESNEFNPNVALEVGYMLGLKKHVLLLKDGTLHALHTDLVGKLYREFDPQNPGETIPPKIASWLTDKGLA